MVEEKIKPPDKRANSTAQIYQLGKHDGLVDFLKALDTLGEQK